MVEWWKAMSVWVVGWNKNLQSRNNGPWLNERDREAEEENGNFLIAETFQIQPSEKFL